MTPAGFLLGAIVFAIWTPIMLALIRLMAYAAPALLRDVAAETHLRARERAQGRWRDAGKPGIGDQREVP